MRAAIFIYQITNVTKFMYIAAQVLMLPDLALPDQVMDNLMALLELHSGDNFSKGGFCNTVASLCCKK